MNIFKYLKGNIKSAILGPLFIIVDTAGMISIPFLTSKIMDIGIPNGDKDYIIRMGIYMIIVSMISMIGGFLAMYYSSKAAYGFGANLRKDLIEKVQEFSFSNINKFGTASLITRITNDVEILVQLVQMCLRMVIRTPVMLIGGIFMMITMSPKVALIFLALIPLIAIVMGLIIKKGFPLFKVVQTSIDNVNNVIRENLIGARVVKSFVRQDYENQRFDKVNTELMDITIKSYNIMILLMPTLMLIMNLSIAAVLWIGASGTIEVGAISASITYMTMTLMSLMMLSMIFMNFSRAKASTDRISEILNEIPDVDNKENCISKSIEKGEVEFDIDEFSFKDSKGEAILNNIKCKVNSGEMVAIIGSTGTGKSTLVNLIPRFYDVTKGSVKIDGIDTRDYDMKTLRDSIGMVLQENRLFSGTIMENIRWGKKDATLEEIKHACQVAQIDEYIESLPDKYESWIEERGSNFSGGQKQRLAIARALVKKPKILILDDSVSALDSTTELKLRTALKIEFKNTTIFMIVQKISSCKEVDRVLVIDDGTIVGNGTHAELIENNEIYKEISESQKEVMPEE
ncbi:MAG: ABC transporter ATP-binding protein [Clostridia bacterium]|nr:ABC transporter ATP-binding protein [Clostridia bacterium]